jgi:hypothetical protein
MILSLKKKSFLISGILKQTYDKNKLSRILWYYGIVGAVTERWKINLFQSMGG